MPVYMTNREKASSGKGRLKVKSEIADFRYRRKNGYHGQKEKTDIRDRKVIV